jgi:hypothetical protein
MHADKNEAQALNWVNQKIFVFDFDFICVYRRVSADQIVLDLPGFD